MLAHCLGNVFGEDILPETSISIDDTQVPPIYYAIAKHVSLIGSIRQPHMTTGVFITGNGWGVDFETYEANIGNYTCTKCLYNTDTYKCNDVSVVCVNNEKGGLANLLFQDSDIHIKNEHYIEKNGAFHYARIDVDHADLIFIPRKNEIIDLKDTLVSYGFSCKSLSILQELLDQKEVFKKSIQDSLEIVAQLFSDERIKQIYLGKEGFKYSNDESRYYHSTNIAGNAELSKVILHNFESIFFRAQDNLNNINNDHSFSLLGEVCNPEIEL